MTPICGWFLSSRPFVKLAYKSCSDRIPGFCSGMNTQKPSAVHRMQEWAAFSQLPDCNASTCFFKSSIWSINAKIAS